MEKNSTTAYSIDLRGRMAAAIGRGAPSRADRSAALAAARAYFGVASLRGTRKAQADLILVDLENRRPEPVSTPAIEARLRAYLAGRYTAEIARRGGETTIEEKSRSVAVRLVDWDSARRLGVMRAEGWRHYSQRFGARRATLCYLVGEDDNGSFAARVPGDCDSVDGAIYALEPTAVRDARDACRRVLRQGDVYAIEMTRDRTAGGRGLPAGHSWDAETRTVVHTPSDGRAHSPMRVPFPAKFVQQKDYAFRSRAAD